MKFRKFMENTKFGENKTKCEKKKVFHKGLKILYLLNF